MSNIRTLQSPLLNDQQTGYPAQTGYPVAQPVAQPYIARPVQAGYAYEQIPSPQADRRKHRLRMILLVLIVAAIVAGGVAAYLILKSSSSSANFGVRMIGGGGVGWTGDVNGDDIPDMLVSSSVQGWVYIVFGRNDNASWPHPYELSDVNGLTGSLLYLGEHAWYDDAGFDIRGVGDINADGIGDIIIGAPLMYGNDASRLNITFGAGQAWVIYGKYSWPSSIDLDMIDATDGFVLNASMGLSYAGFSVSGAGDVDHDGIDDLLISVPAYNLVFFNWTYNNMTFEEVANRSGSTFLLFGRSYADPFPLYVTLDNETFNGEFGVMYPLIAPEIVSSVSYIGDINGDMIDDFAFATRILDVNDTIQSEVDGRVFVIFGNSDRSMLSLDPNTLDGTNGFIFETSWTDTHPISAAGDFNGDGFNDMIVGRGQLTYVLWGRDASMSPFPAVLTMGDLFNLTWGVTFKSVYYGGALHRSVDGAGDVNLDGFMDIVIGCAYGSNSVSEAFGITYVVFGTNNISYTEGQDYINLDALPAGAGFSVNGAQQGNEAGGSVAIVGDVTGDFYADIMIGATWAGDWPEDFIKPIGESYLIMGAPTTTFTAAPLELSKLA